MKAGIRDNHGEFLDRKKQKFDFAASSVNPEEGDLFGEVKGKQDRNPKYTRAYQTLSRRSNSFMLTMNENMIEEDSDTEDEDQ